MKYIQFSIMAVLMFSLALSPAFSDGLAFAETNGSEKDKPDSTRVSEKEQQESARVSTANAEDRDSDDKPEDRESRTPGSEQTASTSEADDRDSDDKPEDRESRTPGSEKQESTR